MAATTRFLVNHNLKRGICSGSSNCAKYGLRQGRFMNKLMGSDVGKRKWYEGKDRTSASGPTLTEKVTSSHVTRRMTVLNKLFMQHVTDLMATGKASTMLVGRRIEVTHVKVTPDFQKVLVFWGSKKDGQETETAEVLNQCAFSLRHELTQLRVIGQVPMIQFVKNKQLEGLTELEKRMNRADYGEDFEPTVPQYTPRQELTLTAKLPPAIREKILQLDDPLGKREEKENDHDDDSIYDLNLPPMRHDVLGLDHKAIMNRVRLSLKKTEEGAKNRLLNVTSIYPSTETTAQFDLSSFRSSKEDSQAFTDFLVKRQMEEKRKIRREHKQSVLVYNLKENNAVLVDDNDFINDFIKDERDGDAFEDIPLESLK